ncbi:MAG: ATP-binding protein, partial [Thermosphaera sp.]
MPEVRFEKISPADFFYRNRDIAGFSSPARSLYMSIRELVENSLDAAEVGKIAPSIIVELSCEGNSDEGVDIYRLKVEDNGIGVAPEHIPKAFATVFYGSKYGYKQSRGTFGLGGTMALLYGQ